MKKSIPFDKKTEVKEFGKFVAQLVRDGITFDVELDENTFFVILNSNH